MQICWDQYVSEIRVCSCSLPHSSQYSRYGSTWMSINEQMNKENTVFIHSRWRRKFYHLQHWWTWEGAMLSEISLVWSCMISPLCGIWRKLESKKLRIGWQLLEADRRYWSKDTKFHLYFSMMTIINNDMLSTWLLLRAFECCHNEWIWM